MARKRKEPKPIKLEVHYEYVPVEQIQPAIDMLAVMLRNVKERIEAEKYAAQERINEGDLAPATDLEQSHQPQLQKAPNNPTVSAP